MNPIKLFHTAPPIFMKELQPFQEFTFIEAAGALQHQEYLDYLLRLKALRPELFSIMDNSVYLNNEPLPTKDFMKVYEQLLPSCVIAPDFPYDLPNTITATDSFVKEYTGKIDARIMGVPQGNSYAEYMTCFMRLLDIPEISIIGINMFMDWAHPSFKKMSKSERVQKMRTLVMQNVHDEVSRIQEADERQLDIHLLGLVLGPEILYANKYNLDTIVSCDSSSAFMHGYNLIRYTRKGLQEKLWDKKLDFSISSVSPTQKICIMHNVHMLGEFQSYNL